MASSEDDDLENRVSVVEREVARLREQVALTRQDAAAARVLASGADHDVSEVRAELRAHTQALNALRETQVETLEGLRELGEGYRELREGYQELRGGYRELRELQLEQGQRMADGFATVNVGMTQIVALLTTIAGPEQE